jgi:FkbM family methyltransferase
VPAGRALPKGLRQLVGRARQARAGGGSQTTPNELDPLRLQIIQDRNVQVLLDVGANEGLFARRLRANGYRGRIVSFEPLSAMFAKLEAAAADDPNWICVNVALGAKPDRLQLNRAGNWASSSLLAMNPRHSQAEPRSAYVGTEECEVARLDDLRAEFLEPGEPVYLKLDVQGYELEVLRGAVRTLEQVGVMEAELSLVALYDGAPLFGEVVSYLDEHGFALLGLEPGFADSRTGALLQVDGLFARV